ncbi:MAG: uncharacterized protein PWP04_1304 [Candidatus Atribacteria bacterium]|nr:uncharacterized protein [Candidatus Atribacteria bacterium]
MNYLERWYRDYMQAQDLVGFSVKIEESDLHFQANMDLTQLAKDTLEKERRNLKAYLRYHPQFATSLSPLSVSDFAPPVCQLMAWAGKEAQVGPMAAVAGAINERVGEVLLSQTNELIVENGGDLLVASNKRRTVSLYAGEESQFSFRLGIKLLPGKWGIATSSGKVGPSLSFGKADAVVVVAHSAALADAWATSLANQVKKREDVEKVLKFSSSIKGIRGILVVWGDVLGVRGEIELEKLSPPQ